MDVLNEGKKPLITVKEARKILGVKYESISDEVLEKMINELEIFAEISLKVINQEKSNVLQ